MSHYDQVSGSARTQGHWPVDLHGHECGQEGVRVGMHVPVRGVQLIALQRRVRVLCERRGIVMVYHDRACTGSTTRKPTQLACTPCVAPLALLAAICWSCACCACCCRSRCSRNDARRLLDKPALF